MKSYDIPAFKDLKEEDKFWQTHSPLLEEVKPEKVQRGRQNRSSFLSIRLTGEELSRLKEQAMLYDLAPSTYARQIIIQAMESHKGGTVPPELLISLFHRLSGVHGERNEKYMEEITRLYKQYTEVQEIFTNQIGNIITDTFMSTMMDPAFIAKTEEMHKQSRAGDVMRVIDVDFAAKEAEIHEQNREAQK